MQSSKLLVMTRINETLAEILEVDAVSSAQELREFESWDSLAALSFLVSVRDSFGVIITTADLLQAKTVEDLERLVSSKQQTARQD